MEKDIFLWLANAGNAPAFSEYDSQRMLTFLRKRRLTGRFVKKIEDEAIEIDQAILDHLKLEFDQVKKRVSKQIEIIEHLQNCKCFSQQKPLFIKGSTCAILCDQEMYMRYSADIDIFHPDTGLIKAVLFNLGYTESKENAASHEDSILEQDGVIIEIHKYFPILSPPPVTNLTLTKRVQLYSDDIHILEASYFDLSHSSCHIENTLTSGLLVTSLHVSVMLLALHMQKDLFWEPYKTPPIRMVEALEIIDLINHPDFRETNLKKLCKTLGADYAVQYAFNIISAMFDLKMPCVYADEIKPLIKLMNASFSPYVEAPEGFLSRLPYLSFLNLFDYLDYACCSVSMEYTTFDLKQAYYSSTNGSVLDYTFSSSESSNTTTFEFRLDSEIDGHNFFIKSQRDFSHIWVDKYPDSLRVYGSAEYSIRKLQNKYQVRLSLPKSNASSEYFVLAMGKLVGGNKSITVIPLELIR